MITFISEKYDGVPCILCFVHQRFYQMISCLNSHCYFYFVKEKYLTFGFLCSNGGALTVARVPTRSFQTLLPSDWVDYETKHGNRRMWHFSPKLSNPSTIVIIVPF
jgi:hypothetical protein